MPELTSLLERTAPHDIAPIDVGAIARTARRRSRRRRAGSAAALVAAIGIVGGVLANAAPSGHDPSEQVTAESPDTRTLAAGMGAWEQLPDAPFAGASDLQALPDGRLLAWGNGRAFLGDDQDPGDAGLDVAVYDPNDRTWTDVERPPTLDVLSQLETLVAGDRLVAIGMDEQGVFSGAAYDASDRTWTAIPRLTDSPVLIGELAWDGRTLVAVRTDPGERGPVGVGVGPHDPTDPDDGVVTLDYRIDAPITRRWTFGADAWSVGAPPPLTPRITMGAAFDGERFALLGGTTGPSGTDDESLTVGDGAVYDVASDTWTPLPAVDWPAVHIAVGWIDGQLYAAGGMRSLSGPDVTSRRVARLSAGGSAWVALPSSPIPGVAVNGQTGSRESGLGGDAAAVVGAPGIYDPADPGGHVLVDGAWESTPHLPLDDWDGLLVSTADRIGNGGDRPFDVRVRRGPGDWVPTAAAPFTARMMPGVRVVGDRLYVVGGLTGTNVEPDASFWVLDLSGTR